MATISGNFYRVDYIVVTNAASNQDPPSIVGAVSAALVNAATDKAAVTALTADLSLSGTQRLIVIGVRQVDNWATTNYS